MAGCSYEYNGYTNYQALAQDLVALMVGNGFILKFPSVTSGGITPTTTSFTLEAGPTVDPLNPAGSYAQPWRIHFEVDATVTPSDPGTLRVYVGTPIQLPDDGSIAIEYPGTMFAGGTTDFNAGSFPRKSGELTCGYYQLVNLPTGSAQLGNEAANRLSIPFASKHWSQAALIYYETAKAVNPTTNALQQFTLKDSQVSYVGSDADARPFSFRVSVSDHGLAICVWEETQDLWGNRFSWLVVQRPVDSVTGQTLIDPNSRCPVFCVYSVGGGEPDTTKDPVVLDTDTTSANEWSPTTFTQAAKIYRFTVREADINSPSVPVLATIDSPDYKAVINAKEQISITEDNQYVISFMNGLTTARYQYKHELDMITYCSANIVSAYSDVTIAPYNNGSPISVTYKALKANLPDNAGMRILMLVNGQGVTGPCTALANPNNHEANTTGSGITQPI